MGGHAHVVIEGRVGLEGPALASGDLRAIAMMGNERLSSVPDVPALVKSIPNMVVIGWTVVAVPKGTPAHVITRLSTDLRKVVADPQLTVGPPRSIHSSRCLAMILFASLEMIRIGSRHWSKVSINPDCQQWRSRPCS